MGIRVVIGLLGVFLGGTQSSYADLKWIDQQILKIKIQTEAKRKKFEVNKLLTTVQEKFDAYDKSDRVDVVEAPVLFQVLEGAKQIEKRLDSLILNEVDREKEIRSIIYSAIAFTPLKSKQSEVMESDLRARPEEFEGPLILIGLVRALELK